MGRRGRRGSLLRSLGHGVFYLVMWACVLGSVAIGVAEARDAFVGEPAHWGTFTEEYCEPVTRGRCSSVGTWTSDHGTMTRTGVGLDGAVGADGTARAQFQPGGWMSDDENGVVHTATWAGAGLWLPWVLALGIAGVAVYQRREWRKRR